MYNFPAFTKKGTKGMTYSKAKALHAKAAKWVNGLGEFISHYEATNKKVAKKSTTARKTRSTKGK